MAVAGAEAAVPGEWVALFVHLFSGARVAIKARRRTTVPLTLSHIRINVDPAHLGFYRDFFAHCGWQTLHDADGLLFEMLYLDPKGG